jgi:hypothetical protein
LPFQREVYDNTWALMERTQYQYDWGSEFMQDLPTAPTQHDSSYNTGFISGRGNLSSVQRYDVTDPYNTSKIHEIKTGYDIAGNVTFSRDMLGHTSSISYSDSFSDGSTWRNTFAYPTMLTDADGYSSYGQYNFDFGAKTQLQTPQPNTTANTPGPVQTFSYDSVGRIYQVSNSFNGACVVRCSIFIVSLFVTHYTEMNYAFVSIQVSTPQRWN